MRIFLKIGLTIFIVYFAFGMDDAMTALRRSGNNIGLLGLLPMAVMIGGIYATWRYIPNDPKNENTNNTKTENNPTISYKSSSNSPTYKTEVYTATKRLYEWKSDIPAIIVVSTDLIYKKEFEKAKEFLITGDNYNDRVFAIKSLLGFCHFVLFETTKAYDCAVSIGNLLNDKRITTEQIFEVYNIVGRLLPESLNNLSIVARTNSNELLAKQLEIISKTLQNA